MVAKYCNSLQFPKKKSGSLFGVFKETVQPQQTDLDNTDAEWLHLFQVAQFSRMAFVETHGVADPEILDPADQEVPQAMRDANPSLVDKADDWFILSVGGKVVTRF